LVDSQYSSNNREKQKQIIVHRRQKVKEIMTSQSNSQTATPPKKGKERENLSEKRDNPRAQTTTTATRQFYCCYEWVVSKIMCLLACFRRKKGNTFEQAQQTTHSPKNYYLWLLERDGALGESASSKEERQEFL
jgi:hypothetical protein